MTRCDVCGLPLGSGSSWVLDRNHHRRRALHACSLACLATLIDQETTE